MKKQIFVINGGDTFETYGEYLKFLKEWEIDFDDYLDGKATGRDLYRKNWAMGMRLSIRTCPTR